MKEATALEFLKAKGYAPNEALDMFASLLVVMDEAPDGAQFAVIWNEDGQVKAQPLDLGGDDGTETA